MDRNRLVEMDAKDYRKVLDCQAHTALFLRIAAQDVKRVTPALKGIEWQIDPRGVRELSFILPGKEILANNSRQSTDER